VLLIIIIIIIIILIIITVLSPPYVAFPMYILLTVVGLLCIVLLSCVYFCYLMCIVLLCVCFAVLHTLVARLLARSQYSEVPATGHLDTGFSWFPCVYKQMLRWFPRFQVATICFSYSPLNLNFVDPYFIFMLFFHIYVYAQ